MRVIYWKISNINTNILFCKSRDSMKNNNFPSHMWRHDGILTVPPNLVVRMMLNSIFPNFPFTSQPSVLYIPVWSHGNFPKSKIRKISHLFLCSRVYIAKMGSLTPSAEFTASLYVIESNKVFALWKWAHQCKGINEAFVPYPGQRHCQQLWQFFSPHEFLRSHFSQSAFGKTANIYIY